MGECCSTSRADKKNMTHWEVWWWTALSAGHPFKRSGLQSLRGRHTWATQTRWDGSLHQLLPGLGKLDYWSSPGDRVIGQLPVICTAVGGEGMFSGPVTARQICDITVMHCHGGLSLKAQYIEFQLSYCGQIFLFFCGEGFDILYVVPFSEV